MARYEFKLPDIGEGIAEAEIVAWHVKVGDTIGEDQQIADMMTDKATVEMESPVAGKVVELAGEVGDQIPIGSVLAVIETEGAEAAVEEAAPAPESKEERPIADGAEQPTREQEEALPTMLTLTLRNLERDGLVSRTVTPTIPPRVDYELTDLGRSLQGPICGLASWAMENVDAIHAAQARFDAVQSAAEAA